MQVPAPSGEQIDRLMKWGPLVLVLAAFTWHLLQENHVVMAAIISVVSTAVFLGRQFRKSEQRRESERMDEFVKSLRDL